MKRYRVVFASMLALASGALMGASCGDKDAASPNDPDDYEGVGKALDRQDGVDPAAEPPAEGGSWEVQGVDVSKLSDTEKKRFAVLMDKLPSPCGAAHSLRTSVEEDESCKRALFAARYVGELVAEDLGELEVRELYEARYRQKQQANFNVKNAPRHGPTDAKVTIVEFFDHACPHCAQAKPLLEAIAEKYPNDVVVYYKFFPLSSNPNSPAAARAALAAARQGKFDAMHEKLFEHQRDHGPGDLLSYASEIGLDVDKFQKDMKDPALEQQVASDRKEGIAAGLQGTPTIYINGREYTDPLGPEFMASWIDEELAVNR